MFEGFDDKTAIGKRLRFLSMRIDLDAKRVYAEAGIEFEQRWFGILNQLVLHGPMSANEIGQALFISHASVSEARKSLEAKNYIKSAADPADRRRHILSLTNNGKKFVEKLAPIWRSLEEASAELNDEAQDVAAALDQLHAALQRASLFDRAMEKLHDARRQ